MHRTAGQLSGPRSVGSSRFAKSVACTIATSAGQPDPAQSVRTPGHVLPSGCSAALPRAPPLSVVGPDVPTKRLAPLPVICSLPAFPRLSREHRPLPTEWDEVLAKDTRRLCSTACRGFEARHSSPSLASSPRRSCDGYRADPLVRGSRVGYCSGTFAPESTAPEGRRTMRLRRFAICLALAVVTAQVARGGAPGATFGQPPAPATPNPKLQVLQELGDAYAKDLGLEFNRVDVTLVATVAADSVLGKRLEEALAVGYSPAPGRFQLVPFATVKHIVKVKRSEEHTSEL